jgi:hypothetical protein
VGPTESNDISRQKRENHDAISRDEAAEKSQPRFDQPPLSALRALPPRIPRLSPIAVVIERVFAPRPPRRWRCRRHCRLRLGRRRAVVGEEVVVAADPKRQNLGIPPGSAVSRRCRRDGRRRGRGGDERNEEGRRRVRRCCVYTSIIDFGLGILHYAFPRPAYFRTAKHRPLPPSPCGK